MAFFRFNRDKRGYEHFYLVEPVTDRRGKTRTRVLYWYRTPPNIRVGRTPFDEDAQRALEAQNPSVTFDWRKIIEAPIPSAEAEKWRERRRAERAEKAARQATAAREAPPPAGPDAAPVDDAAGPPSESPVQGTREHPYRVTADQIRKKRRRRRGRGRPTGAAAAVVAAGDATVPDTAPDATSAPDVAAGDALAADETPHDTPGE